MNELNATETDETCNVCGSTVEVEHGRTQCSWLSCPTNSSHTDLDTDATANDVYENSVTYDVLVSDAVETYYEMREAASIDEKARQSGRVASILDVLPSKYDFEWLRSYSSIGGDN